MLCSSLAALAWMQHPSSRKLLNNHDPRCSCSRIATGYMKVADLDKFHDENGTSFREAASAAGFKAASSQVGLAEPTALGHIWERMLVICIEILHCPHITKWNCGVWAVQEAGVAPADVW